MIEDVRTLINKHNYKVRVRLTPAKEVVISIPARLTPPIIPNWEITYQITNHGVSIDMKDGNGFQPIYCPLYACRSLIMADINRIVKNIDYEASLIDFFDGDDIITAEEFFNRMLPANILLDEDNQKLEESLVLLVDKAKKFVLPFHAEFGIEAQIAGVEHGYALIEGVALGLGE